MRKKIIIRANNGNILFILQDVIKEAMRNGRLMFWSVKGEQTIVCSENNGSDSQDLENLKQKVQLLSEIEIEGPVEKALIDLGFNVSDFRDISLF